MRKLYFLMGLLCLAAFPALSQESPGKILESWITRCQVGNPEIHGNLAIYPVTCETAKLPGVLTLDQALKEGGLKIAEVGEGGSVNTLRVENAGQSAVYIMAGEILSGAKQDRILQHDLWLPAQSGKVEVACYCVEHGRWRYNAEGGGGKDFSSKATVANLQVRADGREMKSQGAVWDSVSGTQTRGGYAAPTSSLNAAYDDVKVKAEIDDLVGPFADLVSRNPNMTGVVVQVGDDLLAADCFSDRKLMNQLWPKLLKSYALEANTRGKGKPAAKTEAARRFLLNAAAAEPTRQSTPGSGVLVELGSGSVTGEALLVGEGLAHLELFARSGKSPKLPNVAPIQRQYPR